MQITKSLSQICNKIMPAGFRRCLAGNHHVIDARPRPRRKFGPRQRAKPSPRPVAPHRIADLFGCSKAETPVRIACRHSLKNEAFRDRFHTIVAGGEKAGP